MQIYSITFPVFQQQLRLQVAVHENASPTRISDINIEYI